MNCFKPIIGVVGRFDELWDHDKAFCMWEHIQKSIDEEGGIPILLVPKHLTIDLKKSYNEEKADIQKILSLCDGLLLQGGYKWEAYDEYIYQEALALNMPILGICLGMQMMAKMDCNMKDIAYDNTVINDTKINHNDREKQYVHEVNIVKDTLLSDIVKVDTIKVNSRHRYHAEKINHLKICGYSEDGLIEAIEDPHKRFVLGVQWHPESMISYDQYASLILKRFLKEASSYAKQK